MNKANKSFLSAAFAALLLAHTTNAAPVYWDGGTVNIATNGDAISQGAAGTWDNTIQNWDAGATPHVAWTSGDDAIFDLSGIAAGAGTVTLGAAITANSVSVSTTNYIISDGGNAANTLTVNIVTNSETTAIGANVINATGFSKYGNGLLTLTNASAGLTGPLAVNRGKLTLGDGNNLNGPTGFGNVSVATNATLRIADATSTSYAQTITGEGAIEVVNKSSTIVTTLSGANTHSGGTMLNAANLTVSSLDETGPNALGTGPLQIADSSSATVFTYGFPGGDVTTSRSLIFGGTGASHINNSSGGVLTLAGPISFAASATGSKQIVLRGNMPSTFASVIPDNGANATRIHKQETGTWLLTGSNTFSGGVSFQGGSSSGILMITNDTGLGAATGNITFTTNGSTSASSGTITITNFPVTLAATRTITFTGPNAGGAPTANFTVTDTNGLTVESFITGIGNVRRLGTSSSLTGPVRFANDANNYSGTFTLNFGITEFTSVANGGSASSLGAGSGAIIIANGSSAARFSHIGASNRSTTRALNWTATTGRLLLESSGAGTLQYLATASLKSGAGSATLTLQGTNTGDNTLAQVVNNSSGTTTLTKEGTGKWILTAANTFSGTTTISGGTLQVGSDANLGTAPGAATPDFLILNNGILAASAGFALNANRGIALGPTGTNSLGDNATGNGGIDVAAAQTLTYAGIMADRTSTNSGGLVKSGAGTLTLSGANTFTGNTTISAGTLALSGSGTIGASNLVINSGATFDVSALGGGYTLGANQILLATNGATATVIGSLNLASSAVVLTNVINTPTLNVTNGNLTLGAAMPFTVNINNGGTPLAAGNYKIISKGAGGVVAGTVPSSVTVAGDGLVGGATASLSITSGELYLDVTGGTLIPPVVNSFGLGGGGVVLSFSGPSGQAWKILSSTNVALPLASWSIVTTGTFSGATVNYTNASPVEPQLFYIITSP